MTIRKTEAIIDEVTDMYTTENDISLDHRTNMIRLMNQRLASAVDLQMQMKQAVLHAKVKNAHFPILEIVFSLNRIFKLEDFDTSPVAR